MSDFNIQINRNIIPVSKGKTTSNIQDRHDSSKEKSFEAVLGRVIEKEENIKFSKHAQERLLKRNIKFSSQDLTNINTAVKKAAEKGIKDTLIIMGNTALIANVKNHVIVTATTEESLRDNVFTNIDGAIII